MSTPLPPYPGARWWKFDFHTHTPASKDTAWQNAKGTGEEVTPEKWLLKFMEAKIDCVAVTDHNSGEWVDQLKETYARMEKAAGEGFRSLTLFPGIEISVNGGVHVLAVLDPAATTSDISALRGSVGYDGTEGDSDRVTSKGLAEVFDEILNAGGIPIPAHADGEKGLLECMPGSRRSKVDAKTIEQALGVEGLLAIEWCDLASEVPEHIRKETSRLARVLGSDTHSFRGKRVPGGAFTWVKMATPTLEGLRLALLDGADSSIRRSDGEPFNPDVLAEDTISAIEIEDARYMGNGQPARIVLSPFFNAVVGGRGTGKSTLVHALRLASGRGTELEKLPDPLAKFEAFRTVPTDRNKSGALRNETKVKVEWRHAGSVLRLAWSKDAAIQVEEWRNGAWSDAPSQAVNGARFPLRIFSQGQIAAMADGGRAPLLLMIDESAEIKPLQVDLEDARRTFMEQRARLRTLRAKVDELPEVERKLEAIGLKLKTFAETDHAEVLQSFSSAQNQQREVKTIFSQAREVATRLDGLAKEIVLDDWPAQLADSEADLQAWRRIAENTVDALRDRIHAEAAALRENVDRWNQDPNFVAWRERSLAAQKAHAALQDKLRSEGVQDPGAFGRLTQERQALEQTKKGLERLDEECKAVEGNIEKQQALIAQRRTEITAARQAFVARVLQNNEHVRITVEPLGFDPRQIELQLRDLLDVSGGQFADAILESGQGLASKLAGSDQPAVSTTDPTGATANAEVGASRAKDLVLHEVRRQLIEVDRTFGGHFRKHLTKKLRQPEFEDRILTWFPEDDLRIQYQRDGRWVEIERGSQGQRSAALLAFFLAFGTEPLVLDQPEDDLDNHLIYDLIVQQIRQNKLRRQLVIVTHNPNVVVNGDAEMVHVMDFQNGQCVLREEQSGALQQAEVRKEVCRIMEGGREAFARRWKRLGGSG